MDREHDALCYKHTLGILLCYLHRIGIFNIYEIDPNDAKLHER